MTASDGKLFLVNWGLRTSYHFDNIYDDYIYIYSLCCDTILFSLFEIESLQGDEHKRLASTCCCLCLLRVVSARTNRMQKKKWKHKLNLKQLVFATFRVLSSVSRKPVLVTCLKFMSFFICLSFRCWCSPWPQLGTSWFYVPCYFG